MLTKLKATIAIGYGVVSDIAAPSERGGFVGGLLLGLVHISQNKTTLAFRISFYMGSRSPYLLRVTVPILELLLDQSLVVFWSSCPDGVGYSGS